MRRRYDRAPFLGFRLQKSRKVLRSAADRFHSELVKSLLSVSGRKNLRSFLIKSVDNGFRRTGWRHDPIPRTASNIPVSFLCSCRHVGKEWTTRVTGNDKRSQLARFDIGKDQWKNAEQHIDLATDHIKASPVRHPCRARRER
jgi:hypothetical protein